MRLKLGYFLLLVLLLVLVSLLFLLFYNYKEQERLQDRRIDALEKEVAKTHAADRTPITRESKSEKLLIEEFNRMTRIKVPSLQGNPKMSLRNISTVCHTPECVALSESSLFGNTSAVRIPRIRHILWKSERVSSYMASQLRTWSAIHPNWIYVLWRDSDLEKFVAKYYTGVVAKFKSLPRHIMRVDMIRHMILHKFGGVYADLDYVLVRPLDRFLKFPAVVTRETEAHSFFHFGMGPYPPPVLANPAFMMSEPGHPFYLFAIIQMNSRGAGHFNQFAGPPAVSDVLNQYARDFPLSENPDGVVIVPASRNFYAYENNNYETSTSDYKRVILGRVKALCDGLKMPVKPKQAPSKDAPYTLHPREPKAEVKYRPNVAKELITYCKDVNNLDPITDRSEIAYAIHDPYKSRSSYDPAGSPAFEEKLVDIRTVLVNLLMADSIF